MPESYGLLAPKRLDLYRHHPQRAEIQRLRESAGLTEPNEIWLCTTDTTDLMLARLHVWWQTLGEPCPLRIWRAAGSGDLADGRQVLRMRELTLRLTLQAAECCAVGGQLVLSLAGGRKTMSADLQRAGQIFGCHAMLHIVGPSGKLPSPLDGHQPEAMARPLPPAVADKVMPLVVGSARRSELLDVRLNPKRGPVLSASFGLPAAVPMVSVAETWLDNADLDYELTERERAGARVS